MLFEGFKLTGYEYYKLYIACNLHVANKGYDIEKYKWSTTIKAQTFSTQKFRWQFNNIFKKEDLSINEVKFRFYQVFKSQDFKYINPFTFCALVNKMHFTSIDVARSQILNEIEAIIETDILCRDQDGLYPAIYDGYRNSSVSLETVMIIDKYIKQTLIEENSRDIIAWPNVIESLKHQSKMFMSLLEDQEFIDQLQAMASKFKSQGT
jgi:hypothetical protein